MTLKLMLSSGQVSFATKSQGSDSECETVFVMVESVWLLIGWSAMSFSQCLVISTKGTTHTKNVLQKAVLDSLETSTSA